MCSSDYTVCDQLARVVTQVNSLIFWGNSSLAHRAGHVWYKYLENLNSTCAEPNVNAETCLYVFTTRRQVILPDNRCFLCRQGSMTGQLIKKVLHLVFMLLMQLTSINSFIQSDHSSSVCSSDLLWFCKLWSQALVTTWLLALIRHWMEPSVSAHIKQFSNRKVLKTSCTFELGWNETVDRALEWYFACQDHDR